MKRLLSGVTLGITLAMTSWAAAQATRQQTIADRLSVLREGWSYGSDEPKGVAPVTPLPSPAPSASRTTVSDAPKPFPRVNPRELMPRRWFGVGGRAVPAKPAVETPPAPKAPVEVSPPVEKAPAPITAVGTARARMLREMNRQPAVEVKPAARVASRPRPRAGSVLSANAPSVRTNPISQNARLARSIAEEVADSMAELAPITPITPEPALDPEPITPIEPAAETPALVSVEGETPTEQAPSEIEEAAPVAEPEPAVEAEPAVVAEVDSLEPLPELTPPLPEVAEAEPEVAEAETDAGRIRVAAKPDSPTTKLPLFIGGRYKQLEPKSTTVEATPEPKPEAAEATPQSAVAAKAFAARPETQTVDLPRVNRTVEEDFLLTQSMPVLVSKVAGPRTIVVGREATYQVLLANRGDSTADRVETRVTVPEWAEVASTSAEEGGVQRQTTDADDETLTWRVDRLAPGKVLKLDLQLVARSGRPIELAVTHSHKPLDGRTLVQVQEPKLALSLVGPEEVLFGKPQAFRLTLSNPGTGTAEAVSLSLTPPGDDPSRSTTHSFGSLAAGEERTVEIELTAREAGELAITASANAEGGVSAETIKEVFCKKAELVVDWRGPADRYAGAPAVYFFRVRNPGTAIAPEVVLTAELPAGFEVIPAEGTPTPNGGRIAFRAGSLRPGDDTYFELRGVMRRAGSNRIALSAADSGETRSEKVTAVTEVVALADLKLEVFDPKGPVATDQEVSYEVRITNRGSNDARDIRIVGLFSEGIDPHHVEGAGYEINDGRVAFKPIDRMAAGEVREFTIRARAHREGSHLFRAEVLCDDLDIKLAAEETTRFFQDEAIDVAAEGYSSGSNNGRYPR